MMQKTSARITRAFALITLAAILSPVAIRADDTPIVLSGPPNDSSGTMLYAYELGMFAKAGLNVKLQIVNNPGSVAPAVVGGSVTIGNLTVPAVALARDKGIPLVIIAPGSIYSSTAPTSGIIVLNGSPIKKAADLNGKSIATRDLSNLSFYGAKTWIDKNGGDSKTIKWLEITDTATVPALLAGRIDAASVSEPALDDAVHGPNAHMLGAVYDAIGDTFMISAYFTTEDFAKAHPDVIKKFAGVIIAAGVWANKNHAASAKILEKYAGVPVPPAATRVTYAERMRPADIDPVLATLQQYGLVKPGVKSTELYAPEALAPR